MTQSFDRFLDKIFEDDLLKEAAALSYYTTVSLAPLIVLFMWAFSFIGGQYQDEFVRQVRDLIGLDASQTVELIIENTRNSSASKGWAGLVGLATLLISASVIFSQLESALSKIFFSNERPPSSSESSQRTSYLTPVWTWIKNKIWNIELVLGFIFLCTVSLLFSTFINLYLPSKIKWLGEAVNFSTSMIAFAFIFSLIFRYLPKSESHVTKKPLRVSWRIAIHSGVLTSLLFSLGKSLIGIYLGQLAVASAYGTASSIILLLFWIFYSSLILFLSAELALHFGVSSAKEVPA